ncbi:NAD-dependent epimerase/dehydratase family protein [Sulfitobacter sp. TSTF-M16]|uniref:NAD-dependent epimerase/dehydratase family protein n=1 Tax=Sulfitobacter aestuariivivens TaxID=2766981 RepID=A0A927D4R7_9RHOB|nr:NAD-dependent epimerase/dehydratase family protein [Sulfitobacter aestuariivivens]MBD3665015.1 NAD-dependent epimerase/dehydratase family protein [Sulfitobacter aestuariivivens]
MASTISDSDTQNRPILVLGASGRLGQMLRLCWPDQSTLQAHSRRPQTGFVSFDLILEPEKSVAAMRHARAVICLSGVTGATADRTENVYSRNTDLALAAIRAAHAASVERVFLASSAAVYGRGADIQDEESPCTPVSDYGRAKLNMEEAGLAEARALGQQVTALRIGNVAGADAVLGGWHDQMALDVLADGRTPRRSYIGPCTLARTIHTLTQKTALPEILNIAAPGVVEMGALLDAADLPWAHRTPGPGVIEEVALCTKRLERHAAFAPEDSTPAGMVADWRAYQALLQRP